MGLEMVTKNGATAARGMVTAAGWWTGSRARSCAFGTTAWVQPGGQPGGLVWVREPVGERCNLAGGVGSVPQRGVLVGTAQPGHDGLGGGDVRARREARVSALTAWVWYAAKAQPGGIR